MMLPQQQWQGHSATDTPARAQSPRVCDQTNPLAVGSLKEEEGYKGLRI